MCNVYNIFFSSRNSLQKERVYVKGQKNNPQTPKILQHPLVLKFLDPPLLRVEQGDLLTKLRSAVVEVRYLITILNHEEGIQVRQNFASVSIQSLLQNLLIKLIKLRRMEGCAVRSSDIPVSLCFSVLQAVVKFLL